MSKINLTSNYSTFFMKKNNYPKCGSYILCTHYWFEFKQCKIQYFLGKCFQTRRKGILSSFKLRSFCYKTVMETFIFLNSPTLSFMYSFARDKLYKKMSVVFLRKQIKKKIKSYF